MKISRDSVKKVVWQMYDKNYWIL